MYKFKIILALGGLIALNSCSEDFLDAEPITQVTDANFYKTPADAYAALVGCYDGLQQASGGVGGLSFQVASEVMSDNCFGGVGNADGYGFQAVDEFDVNRSPADQNLYEDLWKAYYQALYRCNVFLSKVDQIDWTGQEDLRATYESEVRVIRGHLYFNMVRLWGNVPLLTEPTTDNIPQANPDEVYAVIADDLLFAAQNLKPDPYTSVESGRITAWAAKALLARVYLYYTGYYGKSDLVGKLSAAEALTHLEDVIANSGHALVADFASLWPAASMENYAGEDNPEVIFSVKYTYTSDYNGNTDGNHWMVMYGMREFTYFPYATGWGVTVNPKLYTAYEDTDSRRNASIIGVEDEEIPFDKVASQREYTGYYIKKYTPMSDENGNSVVIPLGGVNFQIGQFQDFFVMRFADVLLMAAELGSANAQLYFDTVRERAYQDNFSSIPVTQENILRERQLEFAFESLRIWDLLRQGVAVAANALAENTTLLNGGLDVEKIILAAKVQETKGLQQIPNNQITLSNGVLLQNAGW